MKQLTEARDEVAAKNIAESQLPKQQQQPSSGESFGDHDYRSVDQDYRSIDRDFRSGDQDSRGCGRSRIASDDSTSSPRNFFTSTPRVPRRSTSRRRSDLSSPPTSIGAPSGDDGFGGSGSDGGSKMSRYRLRSRSQPRRDSGSHRSRSRSPIRRPPRVDVAFGGVSNERPRDPRRSARRGDDPRLFERREAVSTSGERPSDDRKQARDGSKGRENMQPLYHFRGEATGDTADSGGTKEPLAPPPTMRLFADQMSLPTSSTKMYAEADSATSAMGVDCAEVTSGMEEGENDDDVVVEEAVDGAENPEMARLSPRLKSGLVDVERDLLRWIEANDPLCSSGDVLRVKAYKLARGRAVDIDIAYFSQDWLKSFKKRYVKGSEDNSNSVEEKEESAVCEDGEERKNVADSAGQVA